MKNIEIFSVPEDYDPETETGEPLGHGWYYWYCFPGCLPDSDPFGPFASYEEAEADAENEEAELQAQMD